MKKSLLIIDDDDLIVLMLRRIFGAKFDISHAPNGVSGLASALQHLPDIVLLDVEMPVMDGYEVCKKLRGHPLTRDLPVIFISAHTEVTDKLHGYDVGGDDYISKPLIPDELTCKISVLLRNRQHNQELAQSAESANKVAAMAIQSMGDAGVVMHFMREIANNPNYGQIAETALRILHEHGLEAALQLRTQQGSLSRNLQGISSPLEESMLGTLPNCGHIVDLGKRSAFSSERVTIAVKNMPKNDPENYGRSKDLVSMLAEVMDIEIAALDVTNQAVKRSHHYSELLQKNVEVFSALEKRCREHNAAGEQVIDQLLSALEESFLFLNLTETQEQYLQKMIRETARKAQTVYDQAYQTLGLTKSTVDELESVLRQELALNQADS